MMEIPNIFSLSQDQSSIPGLENQQFNQEILWAFNKKDILIKMKTNFLKKADNHEFQLLFYLALTFENEKKYQKSIEYLNKFLKFVIKNNNQECICFCYNRLGINSFKLDDFESSAEYHKLCLENSN